MDRRTDLLLTKEHNASHRDLVDAIQVPHISEIVVVFVGLCTQKMRERERHTHREKETHTHTHTSLLFLKLFLGAMKLGGGVMHFPFTFHTKAIPGLMVG
jgi:pantothenate kinase